MKDKKGFTLIELLAVVVILGLVILVAVPFFTGSMKVFRDDYYKNQVGNIEASGKEFFTDNRIYLPHKLLDASIVDVNTLMKEDYIETFKDYNGNKCEKEDSYVIAVKMGRDNYKYASCIKCLDDDYDNTIENAFCSDAWKDGFTQLTFTEAPTVKIYVGTEKNKLKELIKVYPTISRCSKVDVACSNPIVSISAEGEDGVEPIYPKNIDVVDTNKVGEYEVEYQYENHLETVKGKVIVYENVMNNHISSNDGDDGFYFQKTNNYVRGTVTTAAVQETSAYNPDNTNDWAQQSLTTTFKYTFPDSVGSGYTVARYQIFLNNRWEDYCTDISGTNNKCVKVETREMDENVKFRFVDSEGHVSTESRWYNFRIDKTPPSCNLTRKPVDGANNWYVTTVDVSFADRTYPDSSKPFNSARDVNSGELRYGITTGNILTNSITTDTQRNETKTVTWYGYVEDKANNFSKCETTFRVDLTNPTCSISKHAKLDAADPISELTKVDYRLSSSTYLQNNTVLNPKQATYQAYSTSTNAVRYEGDWTFSVLEESGRTCSTSSRYCKITYDKDEGETGPTLEWDVKRETELADLTPTARRGKYKMVGWHENKDATSGYSSYTVKHETTRTLYAVYVLCGKGEYTSDVGTACITCPAGYRDGEPAANIYGCRMDVSGAYHVKNATDSSATICSKGQWKEAHSVYYNQTSTCRPCPNGYKDGNPVDAENKCIMSVSGGHYVNASRDSSASTCAAGTFKGAHTVNYTATSSCENCACGHISGAGASSCTACNAGTYASGTGNTRCTSASKGHYVSGGGACSQSACPAGSYQPNTGRTSCNDCPAGEYTDAAGQSSCKECAKGTYKTVASRYGCEKCPGGYWCTRTQKNPCDAGHSSIDYSASYQDCYECTAGYANGKAGGTCNACPAGSYASGTGNTSCTKCPAGSYSSGTANSSCTKCPAGSKSTGTGNTSCTTCPNGSYNTGTGNTTCWQCEGGYKCSGGSRTMCSAGQYSNAGASSCYNCSAGYKSSAGDSSCTRCSAGTYNSSAGSSSCTTCPAGSYCTGGSNITSCGSGKTSPAGSSSSSACTSTSTGGGGGGSCFLKGTPVLTKDGYKDIDKIEVGDYVLSYNLETNKAEYKQVSYKFVFEDKDEDLYTLDIDGVELKVTAHHRFYVSNNRTLIGNLDLFEQVYIAAEDLKVGDVLVDNNGYLHRVNRITHEPIKDTLYNLQVEDNHSYYVGENSILVHNMLHKSLAASPK